MILITGGAGYIGSHTVNFLSEKAEEVAVVDNFQKGHKKSVEGIRCYPLDVRDQEGLNRVFQEHEVEAVVHFAADSLVAESMEKPFPYYHNNVYGLMCLLHVMQQNGVDKIIFSSSAAIYGDPAAIPIGEEAAANPTNPYGETKLAMENMMKWFDRAYGIRYVSLRYFNAAGAHESGNLGEDHKPETHLIPLLLQVPLGQREKAFIFGDDYPTKDGTCIRDYIHVTDLSAAHYLALEYLRKGSKSDVFNLGNGQGYSVKEVMASAREVTGHPLPAEVHKRRPGDPAVLVASAQKAQEVLGWRLQHSSLPKIIADAWNWHSKNPLGYEGA